MTEGHATACVVAQKEFEELRAFLATHNETVLEAARQKYAAAMAAAQVGALGCSQTKDVRACLLLMWLQRVTHPGCRHCKHCSNPKKHDRTRGGREGGRGLACSQVRIVPSRVAADLAVPHPRAAPLILTACPLCAPSQTVWKPCLTLQADCVLSPRRLCLA